MDTCSAVPTAVSIPQIILTPDTQGRMSSPSVSPSPGVPDDTIGATMNHPELNDDRLERVRQSYEEQIAQIHEYYQYAIEHLARIPPCFYTIRAEIRRLESFVNEHPSRHLSPMVDLSESDDNLRSNNDEDASMSQQQYTAIADVDRRTSELRSF